ncbi:MAG: methyltransferase domain-containing protein [Rhodothermales bacterium]
MEAPTVRTQVKDYYGQTLQSTADLRTSACCTDEALPAHHKAILADIADEVLARFYGCGSPLPPALDGCTVLDLGCGTGRDAFLAAALVGPAGRVIGIDMTEEQLAVAQRYEAEQAAQFGFDAPNTSFRLGDIEDLTAAGIEDESVDVVISNCVINLATDKQAVFAEIFRVLKPGGELYFSDVFADRRIPSDVAADPVLYGECLGGALYIEDFRRMMQAVGCADYRVVTQRPLTVDDPALAAKLGNIRFSSVTVRAFKLASLEDRCEDFGQVATYDGTIPEHPHAFALDDHHVFETGRPMLICGNSAAMVEETRYGRHFRVVGDRSVHYGLFDCAPAPASVAGEASGGCC